MTTTMAPASNEGTWRSPGYRSAAWRARLAQTGLVLCGLGLLAQIVYLAAGFELADDFELGYDVSGRAYAWDIQVQGIGGLYMLVAIPTAIAFLAWLSRAVDNIPPLGGGTPRRGPRWAIGAWFIPFVNLLLPALIVHDLAQRLRARTAFGSAAGLVWLWWIAYMGGNVVSVVSSDMPGTSIEAFRSQLTVSLIATVMGIAGAVLAVLLIEVLERTARERAVSAGAYRAMPPAPAPSPMLSSGPPSAGWMSGPVVSASAMKSCPDCAETILAAARVCRYCGHTFWPAPA